MKRAQLFLAVGVLLARPDFLLASPIYQNDFEGSVGAEWSSSVTDVTPVGARQFLGQFGNETVSLTLTGLPPHSSLTIESDLLILRSWDGNDVFNGPDLFDIQVAGGATLLHTTFDNHSGGTQAYPDGYPGFSNPSFTASAEQNSLGYLDGGSPADSVYQVAFAVLHSSSTITLNFAATGLESLVNESWGLDNVRVLLCGDGIVEGAEPCDDGNATDGDGCDSNCTVTACGNGIQSPGEACEDGNLTPGDGCSATCVVEYCGDGILNNNGETCEDGNAVNGDGCSSSCQREICNGDGCLMFATSTRTQGNIGGFAGADSFCQGRATAAGLTGQFKAWLGSVDSGTTAASRLDPASGPFVRTCGGGTIATSIADLLDGSLAMSIGCDEFGATLDCTGSWSGTDSNGSASDGCNNWTRNDYSGRTADECATNGTWTQSDTRSCSESRRLYCVEQQPGIACGNGILEVGEECDDGNLAEGDSCHADCTLAAVCGNSALEPGEQCDDGNLTGGDCCSATCQYEAPGSSCGSGSDTACDNPDTCDGSGTCQSNYEASTVDCGDAGTECVNQDKCDGSGACTDNGFVGAGTGCGSGSDTECDNPDTCDGSGTCQANYEASTVDCGDAGTECVNQDKCDGSGACADNGFVGAGTACASDGEVCTDDQCDGAGNCLHTANSNSCSDGDACTLGDACSGGVCVAGGTPLDCDDSDGCTRDSCDESLGCQHLDAPLPVHSCLVAAKSQLQLKASSPEKNSIKWKWGKGSAIHPDDLGSPSSSTTYSFCIYDTSSSAPSLEADIDAAPSSFWTNFGSKGWSYVDNDGSSEGVKKISLGAGLAGKSKVKFQAGGTNLTMPAAMNSSQYFAKDPKVVAQLVASNGLCLTSEFETAITNDGVSFKAKSANGSATFETFSQPGPFAVGSRSEVFVDSSRSTPANGSYPGAATRTLSSAIWYPATTDGTGTPVAPGGPFPVVLIAHGFTSSGVEHTLLGQHLASHGFIAVAPDFPLSHLGAPGGSTSNDLVNQAGDVTFVLDSVVALALAPLDGLFGAVDGNARGVVGHSLGGMTAAIAGYDKSMADPDLDAVVLMGHPSCHQLESYYADGPPLLVMGGTGDAVVPFGQHAAATFSRAPSPKHLVTLQGGTHVGFMDASIGEVAGALDEEFCDVVSPLLRPSPMPVFAGFPNSDPDIEYGGCTMCAPLGSGLMEAERQHDLTQAAVLAFLLSAMDGDTDAAVFLDTTFASKNPDVEVEAAP